MRAVFSRGFLMVLLVISTATNVVLIARLNYPQQWHRFVAAFHRPPPVTAEDNIRGRPNAPVTIVEYADFGCPFCAAMHQTIASVVRDGSVRWVYRHYPIPALHPRAVAAAEAAECAGEQGKFWPFADQLYSRQAELARLSFEEIGAGLKLNSRLFQTCVTRHIYRGLVRHEMADGERLRINGTPTLFINGRRFEGFATEKDLRAVIRAMSSS